ncbi:hypothetical protein BCR32DRAFT_292054 [Anaeromyces robustus]|uniref:Uncharacterized protein n=1 Tax=Anaeromyces robustus TaxID=1754192 RepID=A0A1Y1XD59_9FUNG|nr:hypothetical protein BCR32DRAFT_292054 [Anaeromyces robustus]|eukprot:ORX83314.1 hypothetical protein BCR32DRAFT_292054 [Anaeromyces robustus]
MDKNEIFLDKESEYNEKESYISNENDDLITNTTINGKTAFDYVKYLLNDSELNKNINYSELREELDTSTYDDTFHKNKYENNNDKEMDYNYYSEDNDNINLKDISLDEFQTEYEDYSNNIAFYKKNIYQLKKELLESKNKNKELLNENNQLKLLLQEKNINNEKKSSLFDDRYDIDYQLKLNPEQQITLEKLQELMIQLSKKIEKLKNDNESLKQKVITINNNKMNGINEFSTYKRDNLNNNQSITDILTDEECRYVLTFICKHLNIKDFTNIERNLKNVELTIKAVPQMQSFISEINDLIWKEKDEYNDNYKIHKLTETLTEIKKLIKNNY